MSRCPAVLKLPTLAVLMTAGLLVLPSPSLAATASYTYDSLGRLTTVTYSTGVTITYTYDASGNRTQTVTTGAP